MDLGIPRKYSYPGNMADFVFPIVERIKETNPDYIVANDRGARLIGFATYILYKKLYGRLPTIDGTIRFRRFSKSNSLEETIGHARSLLKEITSCKENPNVLFIDDLIYSGSTEERVEQVFHILGNGKIRVQFYYYMNDINKLDGLNWRDYPDQIGVDYLKSNRYFSMLINFLGISKRKDFIRGHAIRSNKSRRSRIDIVEEMDSFVEKQKIL